MKKLLLTITMATTAISAFAGGTLTPNPFGGGYQYRDDYGQTATITQNPFGGGYQIQDNQGNRTTISPNAFGGGYRIQNW